MDLMVSGWDICVGVLNLMQLQRCCAVTCGLACLARQGRCLAA